MGILYHFGPLRTDWGISGWVIVSGKRAISALWGRLVSLIRLPRPSASPQKGGGCAFDSMGGLPTHRGLSCVEIRPRMSSFGCADSKWMNSRTLQFTPLRGIPKARYAAFRVIY